MKVLKNDGSVEELDLKRILITIERISDEINTPLTSSDIKNLDNIIVKILLGTKKDAIPVDDIHDIITSILKESGFNTIAEYYKSITVPPK